MNYNIKYRIDQSSDKQIVAFLKENLPYKLNYDGFNWQYNRNHSIFCYVEDTDKNIIGVNGVIPYNLSFNQELIKTAKNETGYISPNLQGKGVFKKLYGKLLDVTFSSDYKVIWGFTKLGGIWTKLGSEVYSNFLCDAFLVLNPSFKLQRQKFTSDSLIKSLIRFIYNYFIFFIKFNANNKINNNIIIELGKPNIDLLKCFYDKIKISEKKLVFLEIDEIIIKEFIDSNPYQEYNFVSFLNLKREMIGYIIYTKTNNSINISDIQYLNKIDLKSIINIFLAQKNIFKGVYDITFFGNFENKKMNFVFDYLKKRGAKLIFSEMDIVVRANNTYLDQEFLNVKNWFINLLWTECVKR
jgi:hypothetical protein